jgi:PAS domain S-box-containing protein
MERLNSIISKYGNYLSTYNLSPERDGAFFKLKKVNGEIIFTEAGGRFSDTLTKNHGTQKTGKLVEVVPQHRIPIMLPYYETAFNGTPIVYDSKDDIKEFRMLVYFEPIKIDGKMQEVHAYMLDITKWKPEERMINLLTLDGVVPYVSDKWVELSGHQKKDIINQNIFPLIVPESMDVIAKAHNGIIETKMAQIMFYKGFHNNGSVLDLFGVSLPVVYKNEIKFIVVFHM